MYVRTNFSGCAYTLLELLSCDGFFEDNIHTIAKKYGFERKEVDDQLNFLIGIGFLEKKRGVCNPKYRITKCGEEYFESISKGFKD